MPKKRKHKEAEQTYVCEVLPEPVPERRSPRIKRLTNIADYGRQVAHAIEECYAEDEYDLVVDVIISTLEGR